jgi:hypothetical protein
VFAVVDGIGWLRRRKDLMRAHQMWTRGEIDGMFSQATLVDLRSALVDAGARLRL